MALWIGLLVVGIAVLAIGWRGWRVGDVPHCRRCGYELLGIESREVCPECGRGLLLRRSVARGRRRRRPLIAGVGGLLALAGVSIASTSYYNDLTSRSLSKMPVWVLRIEARRSDTSRSERALSELLTRYSLGNVDGAVLTPFIDRALEQQQDLEAEWRDGVPWPAILRVGLERGVLSSAQIDRYRDQALGELELELFGSDLRIRAGENITSMRVNTIGIPRLVMGEALRFDLYPLDLRTKDGPVELPGRRSDDGWLVNRIEEAWEKGGYSHNGTVFSSGVQKTERKWFSLENIPAGRHEYTGRFAVEISLVENWSDGDTPKRESAHAIETRHLDVEFAVHALEKPDDVLTYVDSTSSHTRPVVVAYQRGGPPDSPPVWKVESEPRNDGWLVIKGGILRRWSEELPPHVAGHLYAIVGGKRIPLQATSKRRFQRQSEFNAAPGKGGAGFGLFFYVRADVFGSPDTIDVVIVPDPWLAVRYPETEFFWNEEIVLEDIQLDWSAIEHESSSE